MALASAILSLKLEDKKFKNEMDKSINQFQGQIGKMKNILVGAALGQYLLAGANDAIDAAVDKVKSLITLTSQGFTKNQSQEILSMAETFELMGYNAEQASVSISDFITTGKGMGLKSIGVVLDKDTMSMLAAASAAERYKWAIEELPKYLESMGKELPDNIQNMIKMRKTMDDLKEAMGSTFLKVVQGITDAFGGIIPAMKTAIIAFTAYKTAMIIGNVAIGISKAIALGSVWSAPMAIGMGVAALASIGALIGGAGLAIGALNSVETPTPTSTTDTSNNSQININVKGDKFGSIAEVVENSSNNNNTIQTNFGSGN